MAKVSISYNPYMVSTQIAIDGEVVEDKTSPLMYVSNKRLQEWIEKKGNWKGIYPALRDVTGDDVISIEFTGTSGDFEDLKYAKDKYGSCFEEIELKHVNKESAADTEPYKKIDTLKELYQELQKGPIDEFKTEDIRRNFESAINSDFRIVIVAPMSSGKSTLINAIIGQDLLPAVNQATTAVITEVRDNDELKEFVVSATDKYGNEVAHKEKASKKLVSELNGMKDHKDPEGEDALIRLIQLEGDIPNIPSNTLNTIFVDTPGGNNSQNDEHEEMMNQAIGDENKSLILYVFNGAQLGTNDSNVILQKIANSMKNSVNGKQSRDRFLFVANRMDEYDTTEEPYEEVIEKTILPQLASNGIQEPRLFLTSAQTAKLIRMVRSGDELTEKEEDDLEMLTKRFNREGRILSKYASLNAGIKEDLVSKGKELIRQAKECETRKESEELKAEAAELNCGIPAIEAAIREYLEKYAIAIKIKTVHDTFMRKVKERDMVGKCETMWAQSKESFEKVKKELEEKQEKCKDNQKLQEFKEKIEQIKLNEEEIDGARAKIIQELDKLAKGEPKVKVELAESLLNTFKNKLEKIGEQAQKTLEDALNNSVWNACQELLEQYQEYIRELDGEGLFNIGGYNIKEMEAFSAFEMEKPQDIVKDERYVKEERVEVGWHLEKDSGFLPIFKRIIGHGGYHKRTEYEDQEFLLLEDFIRDQLTAVQNEFDEVFIMSKNDIREKVEQIKRMTEGKLDDLDQKIAKQMKDIAKMLKSQEELEEHVRDNEEKAKWIKEFVERVESLMTI